MNLHILHTISGIAIILFLLCKVVIHFYIDYLQGRGFSASSILVMPLVYLRPYISGVASRFTKLKYLCNAFLVLACLSLLLNIIVGVLIMN